MCIIKIMRISLINFFFLQDIEYFYTVLWIFIIKELFQICFSCNWGILLKVFIFIYVYSYIGSYECI